MADLAPVDLLRAGVDAGTEVHQIDIEGVVQRRQLTRRQIPGPGTVCTVLHAAEASARVGQQADVQRAVRLRDDHQTAGYEVRLGLKAEAPVVLQVEGHAAPLREVAVQGGPVVVAVAGAAQHQPGPVRAALQLIEPLQLQQLLRRRIGFGLRLRFRLRFGFGFRFRLRRRLRFRIGGRSGFRVRRGLCGLRGRLGGFRFVGRLRRLGRLRGLRLLFRLR